ncbi:DUF948 domain-containing protein [Paraliobacillus salinarum]|uniref:DUF948 domain-containing protein n=1 Tax=Paraliobacillus salinarum TaxID=1158996 RepID=UPI0015F60743|nr:DUF948 domain-containing protein [Paraliobacillus salinarum]
MLTFVYISVFIISIAFAITAAYISVVLYRIKKMLITVSKSVDEADEEINTLIPRLQAMIRETDRTIDDATVKMKTTDNVIKTAEHVGETIHTLHGTVQDYTTNLSEQEVEEKTKPFVKGIKFSEISLYLYKRWKCMDKN